MVEVGSSFERTEAQSTGSRVFIITGRPLIRVRPPLPGISEST